MERIVQENVDPNDLKKYESLYNEQTRRGYVSEKTQFDYALCLVRSRYVSDMHRGIELLEDLLKRDKEVVNHRDYLFYISLGFLRLKEYEKALKYAEAVCTIEPSNTQAKQLEAYIKSKMNKDGLIGMAIVGGAALALGGLVGATVAAYRHRKSNQRK